jgi:hypothetical protein
VQEEDEGEMEEVQFSDEWMNEWAWGSFVEYSFAVFGITALVVAPSQSKNLVHK